MTPLNPKYESTLAGGLPPLAKSGSIHRATWAAGGLKMYTFEARRLGAGESKQLRSKKARGPKARICFHATARDPGADVPPSEVVVSGQKALQEARGPSRGAVPAATAAVPAPRRPARPRSPSQAAAAPDPAAQAQPPRPGTGLHGRGHRPLPRPARVSRALGPSPGLGPPGGGCARPGAPFAGQSAGQMDGRSRAMNGRCAQPRHSRKVVAPPKAPAPHILSGALEAGGGLGPGSPWPMKVDRGGGGGTVPAPAPLFLPSSQPFRRVPLPLDRRLPSPVLPTPTLAGAGGRDTPYAARQGVEPHWGKIRWDSPKTPGQVPGGLGGDGR
ncbi:uncharacterized protein LOC129136016 [Pan troglodytes]|uniref:uncharacterized protein LOC129136016 n=1 Tax=Pan troglodytes TaxID=9598 RepID=UPI003013D8EC